MAPMYGNGGGGSTAKAKLEKKGEKLAAKETKRLGKNISDAKKVAGNKVYQEKMSLISEGINPKGKTISEVKAKAEKKIQKLGTAESKRLSKTPLSSRDIAKNEKYQSKVNKVQAKSESKINKITKKRGL